MNQFTLSEQHGIKLIQDFVFEKRGVKIKAKPPTNPIQLQLFHHMAWIAYEYFEDKARNAINNL